MREEIKQRIEQIRSGEVPEGYKKTKVGIVPNEWKETTVDKCVIEYVEKTTVENQYPVLTSARSGLMLQSEYYSNNQVTTNDNIGYNVLPRGYVTYRSRSDDGKFRFNENQIIDRGIISYFYPVFSFNSNVSHKFMLCLLNHTIYRQSYSFVEGTAQQVLSFKKLGSLKYCLPSLAEQEKIAEILSAQDKLIALKEKLIEEKKRQKKALMQQLLTGKKRLPGFDKEWNSVPFKDCIFEVDNRSTEVNQHPILSVTKDGIVYQADHFNKQIASDNNIGYKIIKRNQLAFSILNLWMGSVDVLTLCDVGIVSPAYKVFECSGKNLIPTFAKHFLRSYNVVWLYNINSETGASVVRKNLDLTALLNEKLELPPTEEQEAIAEILSTADKELELLQKDLEQEKQKKKALMQLLLAGIVRV